LHLLTVNKQMW